MKKTFLTLVLIGIAYCSFAQSNTFPATGKVGITTTSPNSLLSFGAGAPQGDPATGTSTGTLIAINDNTVNAFGLGMGAIRNSKYDIWMQTGASNGGGYRWYIGTSEKMTMDYTGNVGIGTTTTSGYKFAVNGTAIATQMTVKLYANWPDYVFKPQYRLLPLDEVKSYIDQNQHLPDMPSEAEINKNGINLGEINTLLTKKVEELTLYIIEQENIQKQQQERIDKLEKAMAQLLKK